MLRLLTFIRVFISKMAFLEGIGMFHILRGYLYFFKNIFQKYDLFVQKRLFLSLLINYLIQTPMSAEQYQAKSNKNQTTFYFISEGPKGRILKKVRYTKIKSFKNFYNHGFGDVTKKSGSIDDLVVTDNKDRDKVLATVVETIITFTNYYPKAKILFRGSTDPRTRLYQIAITKYFEELSKKFDILGLTNDGWFSFEKNTAYIAFLINRKIN
jgi:hypothetical protein